MIEKRFTVDSDGKYWDKINHKYVNLDYLFKLVEELDEKLDNKQYTINELAKTIRIYDNGYIDLNKKYKKVIDENEQLKQRINDIRLDWNQDYRNFNNDTLYIEDHNTKIKLKNGKIYIEVFIPKINEYFRFSYFVTGRTLNKEFVLGGNDS